MPFTRKPDPVDVIIVGVGAVRQHGREGAVRGRPEGRRLRPRPAAAPAEHYSGDELKFVNRNYLWPDPKLAPRTVREDENSVAEPFAFSPLPAARGRRHQPLGRLAAAPARVGLPAALAAR